jgi:outer membrane protein OmpA-like peptidoglycan-associated protein
MCYYNTNQMAKSADVFSTFVNAETSSVDDLFYYAQALKQSGNISLGDEKLKILHAKSETDERGISLLENLDYLEELKGKNEKYKLTNLDINSEFSDFGGYQYQDGVVFLSAKYELLSVKREWTWDGTRFLDAFVAREENGQLIEEGMLNQICSKYHEGPISYNGATGFYFTRNNGGKVKYGKSGVQNLSLYYGFIDKFGGIQITRLPFCSEEYSAGHPAISNDGKTLYFASDMPGSNGVDIYQVSIESATKFGSPVKVPGKVNTEGDEMFPYVGSNGALYFSSNGHIGLGGFDVFVEKFNGEIVNLGQPVNSMNDDFAFIMNKDNKSGYVSSNRVGGKGDDDIYGFSYSGEVELTISGIVIDAVTRAPLSNAKVTLFDEAGVAIGTALTNEEGYYSMSGSTGTNYTAKVQKDNFEEISQDILKSESDISQNFELKDPSLELVFEVKNKQTNQLISEVSLMIKDNLNGSVLNVVTGIDGRISSVLNDYKIGDVLSFDISLSKEGYLSRKLVLSITTTTKIINVSEFLDLSLQKLEIGGNIADLININPIYFDLGKHAIRKDAAVELDKIVAIMNEYTEMRIELGSHTDCRSSVSSNQLLSNRRAQASADYIKKKISNPSRITGVGYGESRLKINCPCEGKIVSNCSEEEHQKNRRTEFIITKLE